MSNQLPNGWIKIAVGEIADVISGGTPTTSDSSNFVDAGSGIAWLTPADLSGYKRKSIAYGARDITQKGYSSSSAKLMPKGSILFSSRAPIGYVAIAENEISTNQGFKSFIFHGDVSSDYSYYYFRNIKDIAESLSSGTTFKELSGSAAKKLPFILCSYAEQKEIAARLDDLLAQVDMLKMRLDAIPNILKRFRQSVLAAAVSGKLTEEWRGEPNYTQIASSLNIPVSWQLLTIEDIAVVKGGKRLPKGEELISDNTGFPYIRAGQLKDGTVNANGQLYLLPHIQKQISQYIVNTNDVYITIVGACIGDAGIIPEKYNGANLTENAAKICGFEKLIESNYLSAWLRSQYIQDLIQGEIKSGAQGKLALKRIRTLPIALPPIEEQKEIVRRVEELFAFADQIEQQVKAAQQRVNNLTQAILAKAFRGELTAQWREQNPDLISGENSAAALLARIKESNSNNVNILRHSK